MRFVWEATHFLLVGDDGRKSQTPTTCRRSPLNFIPAGIAKSCRISDFGLLIFSHEKSEALRSCELRRSEIVRLKRCAVGPAMHEAVLETLL